MDIPKPVEWAVIALVAVLGNQGVEAGTDHDVPPEVWEEVAEDNCERADNGRRDFEVALHDLADYVDAQLSAQRRGIRESVYAIPLVEGLPPHVREEYVKETLERFPEREAPPLEIDLPDNTESCDDAIELSS